MTTIKVVVKDDHLQRLASKRPPLLAISELIWNAVDGDAMTVDVFVEEDSIGGLSVRVLDNGHGIPHEQALRSFRNLGASWKKGRHSPDGRLLHGQAGEGRFSAFSIGTHVRWKTRWRDGNEAKERDSKGDLSPVQRLDGSQGIVDLMLSRQTVLPGGSYEHLVVELKRPSKDIDAGVLQQIESYAFAVAKDERFRDSSVRWVFWAVSNDMDEFARQKVTGQPDRPDGMLDSKASPNMTIWVKTWGQVIDQCRTRLQFFQERLKYMATHESGVEHLQKVYSQHVPDDLRTEPAR